MKVSGIESPEPQKSTDRSARFERLLKKVVTRAPSLDGSVDRLGAHPLTASAVKTLEAVRTVFHGEANRLVQGRSDMELDHQERIDERAIAQICQELTEELDRGLRIEVDVPEALSSSLASRPDLKVKQGAPSAETSVAPSGRPAAPERVTSMLELIEKIEVMVRQQRPALRLELKGPMAGVLEIERTGPREVALKIVGLRGPPSPGELSQLRRELRAKKLKLSALWVR